MERRWLTIGCPVLFAALALLLFPAIGAAQPPPPPSLSITGGEIQEQDSGTSQLLFRVTRSGDTSQRIQVNFRTEDLTATGFPSDSGTTCPDGTDFGRPQTEDGALPLPLDFAPGATERTIAITICSDRLDEDDETFEVRLLDTIPAGVAITQDRATGTIRDNDPQPSLRIGNVTVAESAAGAAGRTMARFSVTLSDRTSKEVRYDFATANGSSNPPARGGADCTSGVDYVTTSGAGRSFAAGTIILTQQIEVPVCGDLIDEIDETFVVRLSNVSNASTSQDRGTATITDDDAQPTATVANQTLLEGDGPASTNMIFTVSLSAASGRTVTVNVATAVSAVAPAATPSADAICSAGEDYQTRAGSVIFTPSNATGVTPTTRTFTVPICGDLVDEANETFRVQLPSANGATIGAGATGTITDNDPLPRLTISSQSFPEGAAGTTRAPILVAVLRDAAGNLIDTGRGVSFTVRTEPAAATTSIDPATGGSACGATGIDHVHVSGQQQVIETGSNREVVGAGRVCGDAEIERGEQFRVIVENVQNAQLINGIGVVTIQNDDGPTLTIGDRQVSEGDVASFTVRLNGATLRPVEVAFNTVNGTAVNSGGRAIVFTCSSTTSPPSDYAFRSGTVTFPASFASSQTQTISVPTCEESQTELDETFKVQLSAAEFGAITDGEGVGTILDDDLCVEGISCNTGVASLTPASATVDVGQRFVYTFGWTVPGDKGRVWRDLRTMELRLRDGDTTLITIRWNEEANTFCLVDSVTGDCGSTTAPGADAVLSGDGVRLHGADSSVQGSGPTGQDVTLRLSLSFESRLAGSSYRAEVAASDDLGNRDDFQDRGILTLVDDFEFPSRSVFLPLLAR